MSVLDQDHPDIAAQIARLSSGQAHQAAIAISKLAVSRSGLHHELVDKTLQDLAAGTAIHDGTVAALHDLYDELEEPYLDVLGPDKDGNIDDTALTQFQQAMAVEALANAASGNLHDTADNALAYLEPAEIKKILEMTE